MNTIRRKISIGFLAVSIVLVCAMAINIFELKRLGSDADQIIDEGALHTEYATKMLNALQKQNRAILKMTIIGATTDSTEYEDGVIEFNATIAKALEKSPNNSALKRIQNANKNYTSTIEQHSEEMTLEENKAWFMNTYIESYYALDGAIKNYMIAPPKSSVAEHVSSLEDDIYKTVTPSVLTLLVAILILLLFYYFIDTYYTKPVRNISRSLDNYVNNKVPYQVKIEEKSELSLLNDNIAELINHNKKQQ